MSSRRELVPYLYQRLRREVSNDGVVSVTRRWSVHSREFVHRSYLQRRFGFEDPWHCQATPASRRYKGALADLIVSLRPANVVEVGCGLGDVGQLLPEDIRYTGFDIDPHVVEAARHSHRRRPNLSFKTGGFDAAAHEQCDVVIAVAWIDRLPPTQLLDHMERMRSSTGCRYIVIDAIRHDYEGSWYHGELTLPGSTEVSRIGPPEVQLERELRLLAV